MGFRGLFEATLGPRASPTAYSTIKVKDGPSGHAQLFAVNDILRMKTFNGTSVLDNWLKVISAVDPGASAGHFIYNVQRMSGTAGTFPAGAAVVNYGQSGDGFILLTSDSSPAPRIDIATHTGSPWTSTTLRVRIGNLNGSYGAVSNQYGVGVGDYSSGNYLVYNPGAAQPFTLKAGAGAVTLDGNGIQLESTTGFSPQTGVSWYQTGTLVGEIAHSASAVPARNFLRMTVPNISGKQSTFQQYVDRASGLDAFWLVATRTQGGATEGLIQLESNSSGTPKLTINSNTAIFQQTSIGVGIDPPDTLLHVFAGNAGAVSAPANTQVTIENINRAQLAFLSPNTTDQVVSFGDAQDSQIGWLLYNHVNDSMIFGVNNADRVSIDSNGRVQITTATEPLKMSNTAVQSFQVSATNNEMQLWKDATPTKAVAVAMNRPGAGAISDDLVFSTYNGTSWSQRAKIQNSDGALIVEGGVGMGPSVASPGSGALYQRVSSGDVIHAMFNAGAGAGELDLRYKFESSEHRIGFTDGGGNWGARYNFTTTAWEMLGSLARLGIGGTGTNDADFVINSGSGAGGEALLELHRNSVLKGLLGVAGATDSLITGSLANDMALRNAQAILISADGGTTDHLHVTSGGQVTVHGELRSKSIIRPSNTTTQGFRAGTIVNLADNTSTALGLDNASNGLIIIVDSVDGSIGVMGQRGGANATYEFSDPSGVYSTTSGTASSTNVYWNGALSRYEIENKRGATRTYYLSLIGVT